MVFEYLLPTPDKPLFLTQRNNNIWNIHPQITIVLPELASFLDQGAIIPTLQIPDLIPVLDDKSDERCSDSDDDIHNQNEDAIESGFRRNWEDSLTKIEPHLLKAAVFGIHLQHFNPATQCFEKPRPLPRFMSIGQFFFWFTRQWGESLTAQRVLDSWVSTGSSRKAIRIYIDEQYRSDGLENLILRLPGESIPDITIFSTQSGARMDDRTKRVTNRLEFVRRLRATFLVRHLQYESGFTFDCELFPLNISRTWCITEINIDNWDMSVDFKRQVYGCVQIVLN